MCDVLNELESCAGVQVVIRGCEVLELLDGGEPRASGGAACPVGQLLEALGAAAVVLGGAGLDPVRDEPISAVVRSCGVPAAAADSFGRDFPSAVLRCVLAIYEGARRTECRSVGLACVRAARIGAEAERAGWTVEGVRSVLLALESAIRWASVSENVLRFGAGPD